ncbi:MAG: hypothetical protein AAGC63_06470 [Propionicimonas sp.]|nr:hypothetical protein [Propionicimonas sp.]
MTAIVLVLGAVMVVRTAWVSDDAQITLRSVLNLVNGYGPVFNLDERVQAYTHPLWFGLLGLVSLSGANVFHVALGLGITVTMLVLVTVLRIAITPWHGLAGALVLLFSRASLDYATSGLENPLSHLLVLLLVLVGTAILEPASRGRRLALVPALVGLLYLSRPDLVLLALPFAAYVWLRAPVGWGTRWKAVVPGAAIVLGWTLFSVAYYGFPFPTTAYAKLGNGIPRAELVDHGLQYLWDSLTRDPLTLAVVAAAVALAVVARSWPHLWLAAGILAYLGYVTWIGGDFMSGRFLSAPLVVAVAIIVRTPLRPSVAIPLVAVGVVLAVPALPATLLSGPDFANESFGTRGIADERGFYYQRWGLLAPADPDRFAVPEWQVPATRRVEVVEGCGLLGTRSIKAGPGSHVVDPCGLADPLLARLEPVVGPDWRMGHFARELPEGYLQSLMTGQNQLADADLRAFYDSIRLATRGPLFTAERWAAIAGLNRQTITAP